MKRIQQKQIAFCASIFIGAVSGPFVFKAAGITDFPRFDISHYLIMICYVTGATVISNFAVRATLGAIKAPTD